MFKVDKIKNNSFSYYNVQPYKPASFGNRQVAEQAYFMMNKDVYEDYVAGDISLATLLINKLKNIANNLTNNDPVLEIRAQIIEQNLKTKAKEHLNYTI